MGFVAVTLRLGCSEVTKCLFLFEYVLKKTRILFIISNFVFCMNLDHVRLCEVDLLCFPADRSSCSSSAGGFFCF